MCPLRHFPELAFDCPFLRSFSSGRWLLPARRWRLLLLLVDGGPYLLRRVPQLLGRPPQRLDILSLLGGLQGADFRFDFLVQFRWYLVLVVPEGLFRGIYEGIGGVTRFNFFTALCILGGVSFSLAAHLI